MVGAGWSITVEAAAGQRLSLAPSYTQQQALNASLSSAPPLTNNLGTFNIVIVPGPGLAANAPALAAFNNAAAAWASRISDPITVTINADLTTTGPNGNPFGSNTIGATQTVTLQGGYDTVRNAMVSDAAAQPAFTQNQIVTALPTSAQFSATLPSGRSLSGNLLVTKANAKALGFTGLDAPPASGGFGPSDAIIDFNTNFTFDYDNSNGVSPGEIDFQTSATHEIGHVLGFTSSVDTIDTTTSATTPTISPTTLDLFRFGRLSGNPATTSDFTTFSRNLVPGVDTITDDTTNEYRMSTGINGGDGEQASHWKDNNFTGSLIGIMDPTLPAATVENLTDADFRAIDLIGYDVTPEPGAVAMFLIFVPALLRRRRSRAS